MTPTEINIAIAEACGWDSHCNRCSQGIIEHFDGEGNFAGSSGCDYCQGLPIPLPDYCNDLNAMHEAEKTLSAIKVRRYVSEIWAAMCRSGVAEQLDIGTIHATAAQRAEAFLKTIGKWRDQ